jgi:SNF2 family DNA or RNA helicase
VALTWVIEGNQLFRVGHDVLGNKIATALETLVYLRSCGDKTPNFIGFSSSPAMLDIATREADSEIVLSIRATNGFTSSFIDSSNTGVILENVWHPVSPYELESLLLKLETQGLQVDKVLDISSVLKLNALELDTESALKVDTSALRSAIARKAPIRTALAPGTVLYPYQTDGVAILGKLADSGFGALLADEMGLGKTLQIIALLSGLKEANKYQHLIVAPVSLLENWRREFLKFAPQIKILIRTGGNRSFEPSQFEDYDVVVSNYETVVSDLSLYQRQSWYSIVLDEAQYIKNSRSARSLAVRAIPRKIGIAVTGTPFENHTSDIWPLIDFTYPGYLGDFKEFANTYRDDDISAQRLRQKIKPLIIRRRLADVGEQLPDRIDSVIYFRMDHISMNAQLETLQGNEFRSPDITQVTKLRVIAAHGEFDRHDIKSFRLAEKWQYLENSLEEILETGQKALVFSSFSQQTFLLQQAISMKWPGVFVQNIDGSVAPAKRQAIIDDFYASESGVLILNPQAAGIGLNITAANHVFHFNPEWNPALTEQSTKRSHRRGQLLPVMVHYMFYSGTIEEVIGESQDFKKFIGSIAVPDLDSNLDPRNAIAKLRGMY